MSKQEQDMWHRDQKKWGTGMGKRVGKRYPGLERWQESLFPCKLWVEWVPLWENKLLDQEVVRIYTRHKVWDSLGQQMSPDCWKPDAIQSQMQSHSVVRGTKKHTNIDLPDDNLTEKSYKTGESIIMSQPTHQRIALIPLHVREMNSKYCQNVSV